MGGFRYSKYEPLFGSWHITKQIGQGSIGQVFEIEREEGGHTYKAALKCISIPDSPDEIQNVLFSGVSRDELPTYFKRIKDDLLVEIQFLAKLKGEMTIMNYEDHMVVPHEDGIGWDILIKTELLTPLLEYSLEHPLEEADVIMLGIEICRALESCGKYGIIHRDIKPENIFVTESGDFKLGDFGVAKLVEGTRYSISRKGTYSYMAPEVFHGDSYGPSADLYSLGLVL